jgi:hypothetical protein
MEAVLVQQRAAEEQPGAQQGTGPVEFGAEMRQGGGGGAPVPGAPLGANVADDDHMVQVWMPGPEEPFVLVNPRLIVTRVLFGERVGSWHDWFNTSKLVFVLIACGYSSIMLELGMWCGAIELSPVLEVMMVLSMFFGAAHGLGRQSVQTLRLLCGCFNFWLPILFMSWFAVAEVDMLGSAPLQVVIAVLFVAYIGSAVSSDAYSFQRSKSKVVLQLGGGAALMAAFCLLAHFKQLKGMNTGLTRRVGGLVINMLETASSRALGACFLLLRLLFVNWRRPQEAGVLRCPMERTLVSTATLEELKARERPPLIYPEGMLVDQDGRYRTALPGGVYEVEDNIMVQVWIPAPQELFLVVNPRRTVTRVLFGEHIAEWHDKFNASKLVVFMFAAGWASMAMEFAVLCGVLGPSPVLEGILALGFLWGGAHSVGRLNVQTLWLLSGSFDLWLPLLFLGWFFAALLDMLAWRVPQVAVVGSGYLFFACGAAADAYSFRRSRGMVLGHLSAGAAFFLSFCVLAHFGLLRGLDAGATHEVGGLVLNMMETASTRALGALFLWLRLLFVNWRRPQQAGVLKCPMERTLVSARALEVLKAREQPPLIYPE